MFSLSFAGACNDTLSATASCGKNSQKARTMLRIMMNAILAFCRKAPRLISLKFLPDSATHHISARGFPKLRQNYSLRQPVPKEHFSFDISTLSLLFLRLNITHIYTKIFLYAHIILIHIFIPYSIIFSNLNVYTCICKQS